MGWVVNATPQPLCPREREPVTIVQEARWAPGPVWTGIENLASHGDSIPGPSIIIIIIIIIHSGLKRG